MLEWNLTTWLLLPALAFALGWVSSRLDLRQWRRQEQDAPRAYYKGLNLLLNEQQDKAIDAFIEAVQHDPDTSELHFALGNLFRRRGEFERSVRVHQHLLARADLSQTDRDRAQHALAQDYAKAGLFDRAEAAYRALDGSAFAIEAHRALLDLYERSRQWARAREMAELLEAAGAGSYAQRRAHHWCEEAAESAAEPEWAAQRLEQARALAPQAARPLVQLGQLQALTGKPQAALQTWSLLLGLPQAPVNLVAHDLVQLAKTHPDSHAACLQLLQQAYALSESLPVLQAVQALQPEGAAPALQAHLLRQPSLSAASAVLHLPPAEWLPESLSAVQQAVDRSARPLQRYRCAACGFEAQRYFWQCPGCLGWDTYPPQRIEDL